MCEIFFRENGRSLRKKKDKTAILWIKWDLRMNVESTSKILWRRLD
jgi:hypothetical protein